MARTERGARLTREHKQKQELLAVQTETKGQQLWRELYVGDRLERPQVEAWLDEVVALEVRQSEASRRLAAEYVREFTSVENGKVPEIVTPVIDPVGARQVADVNGPIATYQRIGRGASPMAALKKGEVRFSASLAKFARDTGRGLVVQTGFRDAGAGGRWRRVTDGQPCAFCAMIAGRGPVYSQETVYFEAHNRCGCEPEIVYGTWEPNSLEEQWLNAYLDAAEAADRAGEVRVAPVVKAGKTRDTILYRMRRLHPDLFSDGVTE